MDKPRFKYSPLQGTDSFRVISIQPGNPEDDVHCILSTTLLSTHSTYEALSYCWGSNERTNEIFHQGDVILVTANLHAALRRFRNRDEARTLWVDAICINQEDFDERSQQVKIMGRIFKQALKVMVWLGEESKYDKQAFEFLNSFENESQSDGYDEFVGLDVVSTNPPKPWSPNPAAFLNTKDGWIYSEALTSLLARPWFTRSWVVQETVMAAQIQVVCGLQSCSWSALSRFSFYLASNAVPTFGKLIWPVQVLTELRRNEIDKLDWTAMDSLDRCRVFECTVPHDKVFAFLGLDPFSGYANLVVDYERPCKDVFINLAQGTILHPDQAFSLLSLAGYAIKQSKMNLPSWVPDWTIKPINYPVLQSNEDFEASADSISDISLEIPSQSIILSGYLFDIIDTVSEEIGTLPKHIYESQDDRHADMIKYRKAVSSTCYNFTVKFETYPTEEEWLSMYARLLVADWVGWRDGTPPTDRSFIDGYQGQIRFIEVMDEFYQTGKFTDHDIFEPSIFEVANLYDIAMWTLVEDRRMCRSKKGYLGWVPTSAQVGDLICIFKGGNVPYILRAEGSKYTLVGESYVHGIMYGEAMEMELTETKFTIV